MCLPYTKWFFAPLIAVLLAVQGLAAVEVPPLALSLTHADQGGKKVFESEHAPHPVRKYWLNSKNLHDPEGFLLYADGSLKELKPKKAPAGWMVAFKSPWKADAMHGPNNVYVVERNVRRGVLYVQTAKWITIHHNCSWGHKYKYDAGRLEPRGLAKIPLEIVPPRLWDGNFHVQTRTGDRLKLKILSYGRPAPNAKLTVVTDRGWTKELVSDRDGTATFQLIRDYYPQSWDQFHKIQRGALFFSAKLETNQPGRHADQGYERTVLTATLPWRYVPAPADYSSLSSGLLVAVATMVVIVLIVFFFRERRSRPSKRIVFDE